MGITRQPNSSGYFYEDLFILVPEAGFEPARFWRSALNGVCLPFHHSGISTAVGRCLTVAIGTQHAKIFKPVIPWIPVHMINMNAEMFPLYSGNPHSSHSFS